MPDDASANQDATVAGTIERLRAQRFPDIDSALALEILRLHADGVGPENRNRLVDEVVAKYTQAAS